MARSRFWQRQLFNTNRKGVSQLWRLPETRFNPAAGMQLKQPRMNTRAHQMAARPRCRAADGRAPYGVGIPVALRCRFRPPALVFFVSIRGWMEFFRQGHSRKNPGVATGVCKSRSGRMTTFSSWTSCSSSRSSSVQQHASLQSPLAQPKDGRPERGMASNSRS